MAWDSTTSDSWLRHAVCRSNQQVTVICSSVSGTAGEVDVVAPPSECWDVNRILVSVRHSLSLLLSELLGGHPPGNLGNLEELGIWKWSGKMDCVFMSLGKSMRSNDCDILTNLHFLSNCFRLALLGLFFAVFSALHAPRGESAWFDFGFGTSYVFSWLVPVKSCMNCWLWHEKHLAKVLQEMSHMQ